ncbi:hypothetical protein FRB94_007196 [Tulasnella sp. JGI-2019a]|nr:hypothetical protein FRB93_007078 [Tulasnella sp. JGI-2019a]KAG8998107.1 hypothetical protein FRB94_007196 [Tulasnella sp. JGI-2019a]KAG9027758.1 hypothetical protein FRB95_007417 [Tulasnella sp. JGI-2019a]
MSQTRPQPITIPTSKSMPSIASPADSFPLISPSTESGWVAGFFDFLSRNTGYGATPSSVKSGQHEAKRHGAMGMFD